MASFAARGIPAGDTYATKLVRAYTAIAMARLAVAHPSVRIVMVVDDVGLTAVGQPRKAVQAIIPACAELAAIVDGASHVPLASLRRL